MKVTKQLHQKYYEVHRIPVIICHLLFIMSNVLLFKKMQYSWTQINQWLSSVSRYFQKRAGEILILEIVFVSFLFLWCLYSLILECYIFHLLLFILELFLYVKSQDKSVYGFLFNDTIAHLKLKYYTNNFLITLLGKSNKCTCRII